MFELVSGLEFDFAAKGEPQQFRSKIYKNRKSVDATKEQPRSSYFHDVFPSLNEIMQPLFLLNPFKAADENFFFNPITNIIENESVVDKLISYGTRKRGENDESTGRR